MTSSHMHGVQSVEVKDRAYGAVAEATPKAGAIFQASGEAVYADDVQVVEPYSSTNPNPEHRTPKPAI